MEQNSVTFYMSSMKINLNCCAKCIVSFTLIFNLVACREKIPDENPNLVNLNIGEQFTYFYSSNPCCISELGIDKLQVIQLISKEKMDTETEHLAGGSTYWKYTFEATKKGRDTLFEYYLPLNIKQAEDSLKKQIRRYQTIVTVE